MKKTMHEAMRLNTSENSCLLQFLKSIDVFADPPQWYIGSRKKHGTVLGGSRSLMIVIMSLCVLIYSAYLMFTSKKGSFIYYNVISTELESQNISYYTDFEVFFILSTTDKGFVDIDMSIVTFDLYQNEEDETTTISGTTNTTQYNGHQEKTKRVNFNFQACNTTEVKKTLNTTAKFGAIYCANKTLQNFSDYSLKIHSSDIMGNTHNSPVFKLSNACGSSCTAAQKTAYTAYIAKFNFINLFIKYNIPNPMNITYPVSTAVLTQSFFLPKLSQSNIFFKQYEINSDTSVFPYVPYEEVSFFMYDQTIDDFDPRSQSNTLQVNFLLSKAVYYITRKYDKIDTLLGNFIGVFNMFAVLGKIIALLFMKFEKEIYLFNNVVKNKIYCTDINEATEKFQKKKF